MTELQGLLGASTGAITIELRPPRWWKGLRVGFLLFGALNILAGLAIVALVSGASSFDVPELVAGIFVAGTGAFLTYQVLRTRHYRAMPLVLQETEAILPRLRTNETVRVAYEDILKIFLLKIPALRVRVFVRTTQGDFFVHRAWLPKEWTLEMLAAELARRRAERTSRMGES